MYALSQLPSGKWEEIKDAALVEMESLNMKYPEMVEGYIWGDESILTIKVYPVQLPGEHHTSLLNTMTSIQSLRYAHINSAAFVLP